MPRIQVHNSVNSSKPNVITYSVKLSDRVTLTNLLSGIYKIRPIGHDELDHEKEWYAMKYYAPRKDGSSRKDEGKEYLAVFCPHEHPGKAYASWRGTENIEIIGDAINPIDFEEFFYAYKRLFNRPFLQ